MPKYVALDWDDQQVRAVFANVQGDTVLVDDAVVLPLDGSGNDSPTQVMETLQQSVNDHRYRSAEAIVTIRRADVELRLLSLPEVPADELPDIVRFQALRDFSEISEDWPIDYLHISSSPGEMTVLAATVSTSRLNQFRKVLDSAELKPHSIVLRPCAAGSLVKHQTDLTQSSVQLMVDEFGSGIELTVLRDHKATFIRTVQRPTGSNRINHLAGEIRRTMVAAQNQLGGDQVQQVILFGSGEEHQVACKELQERLEMTVTGIDPFQGLQLGKELKKGLPDDSGRFAATLGLLVNQSDPSADLLDFLNPRKIEEPKSKRPMAIAALCSLAAVLLLGGGGFWWYLYSMDQQILTLQQDSQNLRKNVESAQSRIDDYEGVNRWLQEETNWLEQMKQISSTLPPPDKTKIREFRGYISSSGNGTMILEGVVDNQSSISSIERKLQEEGYRVRGEGGVNEQQDEEYPWRFRETITVEKPGKQNKKNNDRPPSTRTTSLTNSEAEAQ